MRLSVEFSFRYTNYLWLPAQIARHCCVKLSVGSKKEVFKSDFSNIYKKAYRNAYRNAYRFAYSAYRNAYRFAYNL